MSKRLVFRLLFLRSVINPTLLTTYFHEIQYLTTKTIKILARIGRLSPKDPNRAQWPRQAHGKTYCARTWPGFEDGGHGKPDRCARGGGGFCNAGAAVVSIVPAGVVVSAAQVQLLCPLCAWVWWFLQRRCSCCVHCARGGGGFCSVGAAVVSIVPVVVVVSACEPKPSRF